jgi:hypothetical protein
VDLNEDLLTAVFADALVLDSNFARWASPRKDHIHLYHTKREAEAGALQMLPVALKGLAIPAP